MNTVHRTWILKSECIPLTSIQKYCILFRWVAFAFCYSDVSSYSFQCANGWHLGSQTKMAVSGDPTSTRRQSVSIYVNTCPWTNLFLSTYQRWKIELGKSIKFQSHGLLILWIYLLVPLGISFICQLAQLRIQPSVPGFGMLLVFERTGNMSNLIDLVIIFFQLEFMI